MMVIDESANTQGNDRGIRGNGGGVDGDNCDADDLKGSKNGDGLVLKWKLGSATLNFKFIYKFVKCFWVYYLFASYNNQVSNECTLGVYLISATLPLLQYISYNSLDFSIILLPTVIILGDSKTEPKKVLQLLIFGRRLSFICCWDSLTVAFFQSH